jgi:hypothetical protein
VPLEVAAKEPRQAAPIRAQGSAREAVDVVIDGARTLTTAPRPGNVDARIYGMTTP